MYKRQVEKLKQSLKKWAEGDFKTDPQLSLIPSLFTKLKQEGMDFSAPSDPALKVLLVTNVVSFLKNETSFVNSSM